MNILSSELSAIKRHLSVLYKGMDEELLYKKNSFRSQITEFRDMKYDEADEIRKILEGAGKFIHYLSEIDIDKENINFSDLSDRFERLKENISRIEHIFKQSPNKVDYLYNDIKDREIAPLYHIDEIMKYINSSIAKLKDLNPLEVKEDYFTKVDSAFQQLRDEVKDIKQISLYLIEHSKRNESDKSLLKRYIGYETLSMLESSLPSFVNRFLSGTLSDFFGLTMDGLKKYEIDKHDEKIYNPKIHTTLSWIEGPMSLLSTFLDVMISAYTSVFKNPIIDNFKKIFDISISQFYEMYKLRKENSYLIDLGSAYKINLAMAKTYETHWEVVVTNLLKNAKLNNKLNEASVRILPSVARNYYSTLKKCHNFFCQKLKKAGRLT